jgi:hypothetical protein
MYIERKDPSPRPYGKNILNEIENKLRKKTESSPHGFIDRESIIGISRDSLKLIDELKMENDLLKRLLDKKKIKLREERQYSKKLNYIIESKNDIITENEDF